MFAGASAAALSYLLTEQLTELEFVGMERIKIEVEGQSREIMRYVAFVRVLKPTYFQRTEQIQFEWSDVGAEMVRLGLAYVDRISELEKRSEHGKYVKLQEEAEQMKRGVWTYGPFRSRLTGRPSTPGRAMPQRGAIRN
jgi:endonuclease YncB( thermonuclease family)